MKFGVREICDVVFKALDTVVIGNTTFVAGQPVLYIDTAKTSTLESATTTVYATGGKGNVRLLAWEGEKTMTFTVEDALLSPLGFSMLTGAGLIDASAGASAINVHATVETLATDASGAVAITGAALGLATGEKVTISTDSDAKIYGFVVDDVGAILYHLGEGTGSGDISGPAGSATITFSGYTGYSAWTSGTTRVIVDLYFARTNPKVQELQIEASDFGGYYYVEASTLFRDQSTGTDMPAEIVLPRVKIQSNFTFNMAATGDPSTFSFVMDAFPAYTKFSTNKVMCAIQIVGDNDVA